MVDSTNTVTKDGKRKAWIDCAKGIGIILVMIGHTIPPRGSGTEIEQLIKGIIYSFHMPLFFVVSCITFNFSDDKTVFIKKSRRLFKHLMIPVLCIFMFKTILSFIENYQTLNTWDFITEHIGTLFYGSGAAIHVWDITYPAIGRMWFLYVLFVGKVLFDYLHLKIKPSYFFVATLIITGIGVILGGTSSWLPMSFDVALATMIFFYIGVYLKNNINKLKMNNIKLFILMIGWLSVFAIIFFGYKDYFGFSGRRYPLFPFSYISAILGTLFFLALSMKIVKYRVVKPLLFFGKYSLYLFCVHEMDDLWDIVWNKTGSIILNAIIRIIIDCLIAMLAIKVVSAIKSIKKKQAH